jgi:hypothetical protein
MNTVFLDMLPYLTDASAHMVLGLDHQKVRELLLQLLGCVKTSAASSNHYTRVVTVYPVAHDPFCTAAQQCHTTNKQCHTVTVRLWSNWGINCFGLIESCAVPVGLEYLCLVI